MNASTLRHCVLAVVLVAASSACAEDASGWSADSHARVRLIAGDKPAGGFLRAGVELELDPGWKTYWRYPGDSGVPPRFDFAQSENVKSAAVLWPAPHRFTDESGSTIGYKEHVVFPLHVTPRDPAKPVVLRLKIDYAVCEKLCIPAQGRAELRLEGGHSSQEPSLAAAEARVPRHVALGEPAPLAIKAVRREAGPKLPRVAVDVSAPGDTAVDLFAEGPTPEWALPLPAPASGGPAGVRRFAFDLDGIPPGASASGAMLTLTLVSPKAAIEVTTRLD